MFEDVAGIGAVAEPLEEAAPLADAAAVLDHRRQPGHQPLVETGEVGGRAVKLLQIDPDFQHRVVGPDVRTAQCQHFTKFHSCFSMQGNADPATPPRTRENDWLVPDFKSNHIRPRLLQDSFSYASGGIKGSSHLPKIFMAIGSILSQPLLPLVSCTIFNSRNDAKFRAILSGAMRTPCIV